MRLTITAFFVAVAQLFALIYFTSAPSKGDNDSMNRLRPLCNTIECILERESIP